MDQEKKPRRQPIGGISQYATIGGGTKKFEEPDSQITSTEATQQSENLDSQISRYPAIQNAQLPDKQITDSPDKQMVSYLKNKRPERKAQIIYLPPALIKQLKHCALDQEREISEVAADALEQYLTKWR